jgi:hypothetical protein
MDNTNVPHLPENTTVYARFERQAVNVCNKYLTLNTNLLSIQMTWEICEMKQMLVLIRRSGTIPEFCCRKVKFSENLIRSG